MRNLKNNHLLKSTEKEWIERKKIPYMQGWERSLISEGGAIRMMETYRFCGYVREREREGKMKMKMMWR